METIISATDFSKSAVNASKYAAALSAELGAELLLIHVIGLPTVPQNVPLPEAEFEKYVTEKTEKLDRVREQLLFYTENQISIRTAIINDSAESAIDNLCIKTNPLVVIFGWNSYKKQVSTGMGSFAGKIAQNLQFPILFVSENVVYKSLKKAGIFMDGTEIPTNTNFELLKKYLTKNRIKLYFLYRETSSVSGSFEIFPENIPPYPLFLPEHQYSGVQYYKGGLPDFMESEHPDLLMIISGEHNYLKHLFLPADPGAVPRLQHSELLLLSLPIPGLIHNTDRDFHDHQIHVKKNCAGCNGSCRNKKATATIDAQFFYPDLNDSIID